MTVKELSKKLELDKSQRAALRKILHDLPEVTCEGCFGRGKDTYGPICGDGWDYEWKEMKCIYCGGAGKYKQTKIILRLV
jgi:hypothetical protein